MFQVPTIFYFSSADKLSQFNDFSVNRVPYSTSEGSFTRFDIQARRIESGEYEVIAEFGTEVNAHSFRDMAEITAKHFQ
jgi:hypothetical protein